MKCPFTKTSNQSFIYKKDAYNIHDDKHKIYLRNFKIMRNVYYIHLPKLLTRTATYCGVVEEDIFSSHVTLDDVFF